MILLTLALAVLLVQLFPLTVILYLTLGVNFIVAPGLSPDPRWFTAFALNYGSALVVSWWFLRTLDVAPFAGQMPQGHRLIQIGLIVFVIYLFSAMGGILWHLLFVTWTRGEVPKVLGLILMAAKAFLFAGLAVALCKELPQARLRARQ